MTLAANRFSARIDPLGAELASLRLEDGRDLLWPGDPEIWPDRAPLLFPVVGASPERTVRYGGRPAPMNMHGFARDMVWKVERAGGREALLAIEDTPQTREIYPFAFRLELSCAIGDDALRMTARAINRGDTPMPASFGYHPGFRWPLDPALRREDHLVLFEKAEPGPIRRVSLPSRLLDRRSFPSPVQVDSLRPRDELFEGGALIFDNPSSRAVWFGVPDRLGIEVGFPDMPHLGIWSRPGAGFLAIEPWRGLPAAEGSDGELAERPGITLLAPGESFACTMTIAVRPGPSWA
ncbi:MAG: aldose 1-epimerase family protein [Alphaproteobacteria bacterium]|nr:aldose 1-epimerase family protein [Alphaproteobacteria bacterium]